MNRLKHLLNFIFLLSVVTIFNSMPVYAQFQNPVLHKDYSDPDAIRVGDTYIMTASSFNHTQGLPILTSKDLVNWTLKGYAL